MKPPVESSNTDPHQEFVRLFARGHRRIHAFIGTLLPNLSDADEVMQETSVILWQKFGEFDPERDFVRWACGIARLEVFRYLRQRKPAGTYLSEATMSNLAEEFEVQSEIAVSRRRALATCRERLASRDQQILVLRYQRENTAVAVAEQLGRPLNTVYKALARIRRQLHDCIRRQLATEGEGQ